MDTNMIGPSGPNPVAEEQFRKGFELAKAGNIEDATLAVEAAIAISDDDSRYHDLLGTLYAKRGLYEMAVAEWRRSIECDPDHAEVFRRIETAEKLRAQPKSGGHRWNHVAIITLAICFAVASAAATYIYRNNAADVSQLIQLREDLANATEGSVSKTEHAEIVAEVQRLTATLNQNQTEATKLRTELDSMKTTSVPNEKYVQMEELKNRVTSELAAAREQVNQLSSKVSSIQDATGALQLHSQVEKKDSDIKTLNAQVEKFNNDRKIIEEKLATAQKSVSEQAAHISNLETQATKMVAAEEAERLRKEVEQLKSQVARAGPAGQAAPGATLPDQDVLFLLNGTLEAVRFAVEGKKPEALAQLKKVQPRAPEGVAFDATLKSLGETVAPAAPPEPPVVAPAQPEPTATPKPVEKPTEKPATKKPTEKPKSEPAKAKPTAKPKPKATPVPDASAAAVKGGAAVPRPVKRLDSDGPDEPKAPAATAKKNEDRAKELFEAKKQLRDQALALYKQGKFREASGVIDRAYRIDPKDPGVNQVRNAIRSKL